MWGISFACLSDSFFPGVILLKNLELYLYLFSPKNVVWGIFISFDKKKKTNYGSGIFFFHNKTRPKIKSLLLLDEEMKKNFEYPNISEYANRHMQFTTFYLL